MSPSISQSSNGGYSCLETYECSIFVRLELERRPVPGPLPDCCDVCVIGDSHP